MLNVRLAFPDVKFAMFAGAPLALPNVTLCVVVPPSLDQVTVPVREIVTDAGENENVAVP